MIKVVLLSTYLQCVLKQLIDSNTLCAFATYILYHVYINGNNYWPPLEVCHGTIGTVAAGGL
jgi:hypothetical protein